MHVLRLMFLIHRIVLHHSRIALNLRFEILRLISKCISICQVEDSTCEVIEHDERVRTLEKLIPIQSVQRN